MDRRVVDLAVHTGERRDGAAEAVADDAHLDPAAVGQGAEQRTARVALAGVTAERLGADLGVGREPLVSLVVQSSSATAWTSTDFSREGMNGEPKNSVPQPATVIAAPLCSSSSLPSGASAMVGASIGVVVWTSAASKVPVSS